MVREDTGMPHIHERIDFTAEVFVVHDGRVLLRVHDKLGRWLAVGGHVELDEDPNEAAVREVREEVGLDVVLHDDLRPVRVDSEDYRELVPPKFMNRHRIGAAHEHVTLVYFARSESAEVVPGECDRSDEWRWFTREELELPEYDVPAPIRFYARRALDELG
jgi:8-oxo-dGTP pyrophosphatase MutT (NUDIX family)